MISSLASPVLLASGTGGGGLTDVDTTLFVFTLVLFALFAGVLAKFGWKPLLKIIEEREKGVQDAVEGAHKANADAQALLARHQEMLRDVTREREEILHRAIEEAEVIRADLVAKSKAEAEGLLERARGEIERETRRALVELRAEVADLAVEAASKIVSSSMSPAAQKKLVDEFIDKLPPLQ